MFRRNQTPPPSISSVVSHLTVSLSTYEWLRTLQKANSTDLHITVRHVCCDPLPRQDSPDRMCTGLMFPPPLTLPCSCSSIVATLNDTRRVHDRQYGKM